MSSQDQRKQGQGSRQATDTEEFRNLDDVAEAVGGTGTGKSGTQTGGHGTPPGGDVRTAYTADRDPGDPEPEHPRA